MDHVSRPAKNDFSFPTACRIHFKFAAQADMAALDLYWYDGGMKPRMPREFEAEGKPVPREGILFVGDKGKIMAGFRGSDPVVYKKNKREALWEEESTPREGQPERRRSGDPRPPRSGCGIGSRSSPCA